MADSHQENPRMDPEAHGRPHVVPPAAAEPQPRDTVDPNPDPYRPSAWRGRSSIFPGLDGLATNPDGAPRDCLMKLSPLLIISAFTLRRRETDYWPRNTWTPTIEKMDGLSFDDRTALDELGAEIFRDFAVIAPPTDAPNRFRIALRLRYQKSYPADQRGRQRFVELVEGTFPGAEVFRGAAGLRRGSTIAIVLISIKALRAVNAIFATPDRLNNGVAIGIFLAKCIIGRDVAPANEVTKISSLYGKVAGVVAGATTFTGSAAVALVGAELTVEALAVAALASGIFAGLAIGAVGGAVAGVAYLLLAKWKMRVAMAMKAVLQIEKDIDAFVGDVVENLRRLERRRDEMRDRLYALLRLENPRQRGAVQPGGQGAVEAVDDTQHLLPTYE